MNIKAEEDWRDEWCAIDDDTYDGAEDSSNRNCIGRGATREAAIADLLELLEDWNDTRRYVDPDLLREIAEERRMLARDA